MKNDYERQREKVFSIFYSRKMVTIATSCFHPGRVKCGLNSAFLPRDPVRTSGSAGESAVRREHSVHSQSQEKPWWVGPPAAAGRHRDGPGKREVAATLCTVTSGEHSL